MAGPSSAAAPPGSHRGPFERTARSNPDKGGYGESSGIGSADVAAAEGSKYLASSTRVSQWTRPVRSSSNPSPGGALGDAPLTEPPGRWSRSSSSSSAGAPSVRSHRPASQPNPTSSPTPNPNPKPGPYLSPRSFPSSSAASNPDLSSRSSSSLRHHPDPNSHLDPHHQSRTPGLIASTSAGPPPSPNPHLHPNRTPNPNFNSTYVSPARNAVIEVPERSHAGMILGRGSALGAYSPGTPPGTIGSSLGTRARGSAHLAAGESPASDDVYDDEGPDLNDDEDDDSGGYVDSESSASSAAVNSGIVEPSTGGARDDSAAQGGVDLLSQWRQKAASPRGGEGERSGEALTLPAEEAASSSSSTSLSARAREVAAAAALAAAAGASSAEKGKGSDSLAPLWMDRYPGPLTSPSSSASRAPRHFGYSRSDGSATLGAPRVIAKALRPGATLALPAGSASLSGLSTGAFVHPPHGSAATSPRSAAARAVAQYLAGPSGSGDSGGSGSGRQVAMAGRLSLRRALSVGERAVALEKQDRLEELLAGPQVAPPQLPPPLPLRQEGAGPGPGASPSLAGESSLSALSLTREALSREALTDAIKMQQQQQAAYWTRLRRHVLGDGSTRRREPWEEAEKLAELQSAAISSARVAALETQVEHQNWEVAGLREELHLAHKQLRQVRQEQAVQKKIKVELEADLKEYYRKMQEERAREETCGTLAREADAATASKTAEQLETMTSAHRAAIEENRRLRHRLEELQVEAALHAEAMGLQDAHREHLQREKVALFERVAKCEDENEELRRQVQLLTDEKLLLHVLARHQERDLDLLSRDLEYFTAEVANLQANRLAQARDLQMAQEDKQALEIHLFDAKKMAEELRRQLHKLQEIQVVEGIGAGREKDEKEAQMAAMQKREQALSAELAEAKEKLEEAKESLAKTITDQQWRNLNEGTRHESEINAIRLKLAEAECAHKTAVTAANDLQRQLSEMQELRDSTWAQLQICQNQVASLQQEIYARLGNLAPR